MDPSSDELEEELYHRFSPGGIRRQRLRRWQRLALTFLAVQRWIEVKRVFDVALAAGALLALGPLMLALRALAGSLVRTPRAGRWCETFEELSFGPGPGGLVAALRLTRLPVLLNVFRGDLSFVGPRPVAPGELSPRERTARRRYDVRPGLICTWWIRKRANIHYESEVQIDGEYAQNQSLLGDLGIALRAIPAAFYGEGLAAVPDKVHLLGVPVDNLAMTEAVERLAGLLESPRLHQVAFVNADCVNISFRDARYRQVLQQRADLVLADGIGMKLAGQLLGAPIKQNVNGTDLFPRLCAALDGSGRRLFLLGGRPGVASAAAEWVGANYPGLTVAGHRHGYFTAAEEPDVLDAIRSSRADILLVAFGAPRQDVWIAQHRQDLGEIRLAMGVGGLLDFFSGGKSRAPLWVREMGLEWFYRMLLEPTRLGRRYFLGNALFLWRVVTIGRRHVPLAARVVGSRKFQG